MDRCGAARCELCKVVVKGSSFRSSVAHREYEIKAEQPQRNCASTCCVYLATCGDCGLQYVGETGQRLNERFNTHRNNMERGTQNRKPHTHFAPHYNKETPGQCRKEKMQVTIIEVVQDAQERFQREKHWIRELRTVYPWGLNERLEGDEPKFRKLEPMGGRTARGRRGSRRGPRSPQDLTEWIDQRDQTAMTEGWLYRTRVALRRLPFKALLNLRVAVEDRLAGGDHLHWLLVAQDYIMDEIKAPRRELCVYKRPPPELTCNLVFTHPGYNYLGLQRAMRNALEYAWVERMKAAGDRRSRTAARSLIDTSRFIDDLCILNGGDGVREILKQDLPRGAGPDAD